MKRILSALLCLTLLALMPPTALAEAEQPPMDIIEYYGKNTKLDLSPYRGKVILLNFFTEWCFYCMQEMPDIKKAYDAYNPDELAIVLVHVWDGEDASSTESVKARFGMEDMTFFEDEDRMVAAYTGLPGYPASLFLAPDGTLAHGAGGMLTWEQLTRQLDDMGVSRKAEEP